MQKVWKCFDQKKRITHVSSKFAQLVKDRGGGGGGGELYCTHTRARPLDFRNFPPKILKLIPGIDLTRNVGADIVFGVFGSREVGNIRVILALLYINTERGHVAISRT